MFCVSTCFQAIELRARCGCPALTDPDPRVVFSKSVQLLLEDVEKKTKQRKKLTEKKRAAGTQQGLKSPLGAALAISAQQQPLLRKEGLTEINLLRKEV